MTKKELELIAKLGPKGQIVLRKEVRKTLGIKPGSMIRQKIVGKKVILRPFDWGVEMKRIEKIAKRIGRKWPRGLTSVDLIREERR